MTAPSWLDREAWPFTPRRVGPLSVVDEGSGPVLLFAHGTPTWSFEWRRLVLGLRDRFRCITIDHLGFGLSERPHDADYSPEAHARRWSETVEALQLDRYTLVAHDFGGPIALDAALSHPTRLDGVVLFNTIAWAFVDEPSLARGTRLAGSGLFRWAYRHLNLSFVISKSAWGQGPSPESMWRQYTQVFPDADSRERVLFALARSLAGSTDFFRGLWQRREVLRDVPMHLIWGRRDSAFGPPVLRRCQGAWPHATVTELADAGHWPHEEQPEACLAALEGFLSRR